MHLNCVICSDIFVPASDVFVTGCGHLFHYPCLAQWIERSASCPQCRQKTTEKSIHRIYFNVASNENEEDSGLLHNKIDNLKFQLHLKETDIKNEAEENEKLKNQNKGLKDEVIKLEESVRSLKAINASLKDQVRYLKAQNESAEAAMEETKRLRKHLEFLKSVETIVQGSIAEVDDILNQHGDSYESRKSLATYVSVLKREVYANSEKKRELRDKLRKCQRELSAVNAEKEHFIEETNLKSQLYKQLEEDFQHTEQEKKSLQKKVRHLEKAISSPNGNNPRDSALKRLILESPLPEAVKTPRLTDPSEADTSISVMQLESRSSEANPKEKFEPTTPYLSLKSGSISLGPLMASQSSNLQLAPSINKYSIFKKRQTELSSITGNREEAYDGMGGHSKPDVFPVPAARIKSSRNRKNKTISLKKHSPAIKFHKYFDLM